jgi:hypothetical protein
MGFAPIRIAFPDSAQTFREMPREQQYVEGVVRVTRAELEARTRDDTARTSILMQATDNSVWALTVGTDGVVTTTKVRG